MNQLFLVPFRRNRRFVGREAQLTQLHQQLHDHGTAGITGLTGMGGIGKTQLAVEYVYRARERGHYPDGIFWLNAARPLRGEFATLGQTLQVHQAQADQPPLDLEEALTTAFTSDEIRHELMVELDIGDGELPYDAELAQMLIDYCVRRGRGGELADLILAARPRLQQRAVAYQEQSQEEQVGRAVAYLQAQPHGLVVLDNLETMALLEQPLYRDLIATDLPCHLLFTSRQTYTGQWYNLNLNVLPEAAALELLLGNPRRQPVLAQPTSADYAAARSICDILGRLPLALEKAAVHLQNHFSIPIARYRDELLQRGALPVLDDPRGGQIVTLDERHRAGLTATLQSQWDSLTQTAAKEVLKVAGQLPEAAVIPIPRLGLLAGLPHEGGSFFDMTIGGAVQQLLDASLMERLQEGQVRLHPLVREFAQQQTHDPDQFRRLCAGRLIDAYEDFAILEEQCSRRGIVAIQEDLLTALDLISRSGATAATQSPNLNSPVSTRLQTLLRLLQREMHTLREWQPAQQPNFLAQQLGKRAIEMGMDSLKRAIEWLLREKQPPFWRTQWANKRESLALERTLTGHTSTVNAVAITPDGQKAVSASYDNSLIVWNLLSGQPEQTLTGHTHWVNAVAITPDGQKAVSASHDNTLIVWNLQSGKELVSITLDGSLNCVAITPDGAMVMTGDSGGNVYCLQLVLGDNNEFEK